MDKEVCKLLITTLSFQDQVNCSILSTPFFKKRTKTHYEIYLESADKSLGNVYILDKVVKLEYSSELLLEEYIIIHDIISRIREENTVLLDDSKSFLGYLQDGEPAYIITNWKPWINHINNSMKSCL
jgi:hypothetical protein